MLKRISQNLMESATKRAEELQKQAAVETHIAELYDRFVEESEVSVPEPKHVHSYKLYGSIGSLAWKDATPEQAVAIMEAFPPVASGLDRASRGTSYKPEQEAGKAEGDRFEPGEGYYLQIQKTASYAARTEVNWYAELGGELLRFDVELLNIFGVTPELSADVHRYQDGSINYLENVRIAWGKDGEPDGRALQVIKYSAGDRKDWNPFLVWSYREDGFVLEMVKRWAEACYQRRQHSRLAYEEDKAAGLKAEPASARRGNFNAGTVAQDECLNTEEARKDLALAKKHWDEYKSDHGHPEGWPKPQSEHSKGFDHFAWACRWLSLHGLQPDPNGPDGKPYEYGSAWL